MKLSDRCVWIVNRKRTDPWAQPGERFRNVCGEVATHDSAAGPLCAKHAQAATAPHPSRLKAEGRSNA